jgi:hypothetical protein
VPYQTIEGMENEDFHVGELVKTVNLQRTDYNDKRGKIIKDKNENGRWGVTIMLNEVAGDSEEKDILVKTQNLTKIEDEEDHFGHWGCPDCGAQCTCDKDADVAPRPHAPDCHHYMNTLRKKGPDCPGTAKCKWMLCCLSEDMEGPCLALNRSVTQIPTYRYPEKEWVKGPDGNQRLQPKKWPYM